MSESMSNVLQHVWSYREPVPLVQTRGMCSEKCIILPCRGKKKKKRPILQGVVSWILRQTTKMEITQKHRQVQKLACVVAPTSYIHLHTHAAPHGTQQLLITRVTCDVTAPFCVILEGNKSPSAWSGRPVGEASSLCYKHEQRKATESRREGRKHATTVMELIPSV